MRRKRSIFSYARDKSWLRRRRRDLRSIWNRSSRRISLPCGRAILPKLTTGRVILRLIGHPTTDRGRDSPRLSLTDLLIVSHIIGHVAAAAVRLPHTDDSHPRRADQVVAAAESDIVTVIGIGVMIDDDAAGAAAALVENHSLPLELRFPATSRTKKRRLGR